MKKLNIVFVIAVMIFTSSAWAVPEKIECGTFKRTKLGQEYLVVVEDLKEIDVLPATPSVRTRLSEMKDATQTCLSVSDSGTVKRVELY